MSYVQPVLDAIDRLKNKYNSNAYDATTNPGGFANDGHQVNFPASLQDTSDVVTAVGQTADQVALDAAATAADRVATGNDLAATNADAAATAADRVATGNDLAATNADAAATAADRVATGNDRAATNADAAATAADRVATGNDLAATNADAAATAADRIATGNDLAATNADAAATAADRVATGNDLAATNADVVATAAARDKSQLWAEEIEDTEVETGKYSALHHAAKADASATAAALSVSDAALPAAPPDGTFLHRSGGAYVAKTDAEVMQLLGVSNPNLLINGDFEIWQRGTTGTTGYLADRWKTLATDDQRRSTDVPTGMQGYSAEFGNSVAAFPELAQRIEAANIQHAVGQPVTVSFWAKSVTGTDDLRAEIGAATAKDNFGGISDSQFYSFVAPASAWTYYEHTFTSLPAAYANGLQLRFYRTNGAASTTRIKQAKLEIGDTATAFVPRDMDVELAACQRYYCKSFSPDYAPQVDADVAECLRGTLAAWSTTLGWANTLVFPINMRATPSITFYNAVGVGSASNKVSIYNGGWGSPISCTATGVTRLSFSIEIEDAFTVGNSYLLLGGWSADAEF